MFKFTDNEKVYLNEMMAISTDENGEEVLVGLTRSETELHMAMSRGESQRDPRYLELNKKHEAVRLNTVASEHYLRIEKPSRH